MDILIRIGWNSAGWRRPTGEMLGKENSYVSEYGFGIEDWNFSTTDLIDGMVFGYTRHSPSEKCVELHEKNNIWFFSIAPNNKRYLVGCYHNARFITKETKKRIKEIFIKSDVFQKRVDEILSLDLPKTNSIESAISELGYFSNNLCVEPNDISVFSPPIELTSDMIGREPKWINRYTSRITLEHPPIIPTAKPETTINNENVFLIENTYSKFTAAQLKIINRMHNQLSNRFRDWLISINANDIVAEKNHVDVKCIFANEKYIFELKTTASQPPRLALRDAIGQLLEYSYYPGRIEQTHLVIVVDEKPSNTDIEWLRNLNHAGLSIDLFWLMGTDVYSSQITSSPIARKAKIYSKDVK
ncbi:hypothetical protein [Aeromonas sobria]|uniref:hypothetical protein n=1 Tax=Aeromonas sobria TaxID=646 RepID=UPI003F36696B